MANDTLNNNTPRDLLNSNVINEYSTTHRDVSVNEYSYIVSFFKKIMGDTTAANKFTEALYEVSERTEIPAIQLIEQMRNQTLLEVNATMAFYLNLLRSNSSLVGVGNTIKPNYYAARNIIS